MLFVSDAFGQDVSVSFVPESAFIRVGSYENVTVVATDPSGNQQRCYFQVSVQPTQCVDWELKAPANINCLPPSNRPAGSGGLECVATCNPGFRRARRSTATSNSPGRPVTSCRTA